MELIALKEALKARGVRHDWLAAEMDMHPTLLSKILNGKRRTPENFVRGVARALRVDPSVLPEVPVMSSEQKAA